MSAHLDAPLASQVHVLTPYSQRRPTPFPIPWVLNLGYSRVPSENHLQNQRFCYIRTYVHTCIYSDLHLYIHLYTYTRTDSKPCIYWSIYLSIYSSIDPSISIYLTLPFRSAGPCTHMADTDLVALCYDLRLVPDLARGRQTNRREGAALDSKK